MTFKTHQLESDSAVKPAVFGDMPEDIHKIILDYLFQNDKLKYGLLGKRYNKLATLVLLKRVGVVLRGHRNMPYNYRHKMTVVSSTKFTKLVHSLTWKRYSHGVKIFTIKHHRGGWTTTEVSLTSVSKANYFAPLLACFDVKFIPVELHLRITDTSTGPIPIETQKLSITFDSLNEVECQKKQLQCWSKNFGNLKSLSMRNLRYFCDIVNRETLNLQGSETLELETLEIGCLINMIYDFLDIFSPTKLTSISFENVFDKGLLDECKKLRSLALLYYCYAYVWNTSVQYISTVSNLEYFFSSYVSQVELSETLVEFRTSMYELIEDPKYLMKCSNLQTLVFNPVSKYDYYKRKLVPMCCEEQCKEAIRILRIHNTRFHPRLEYLSYGVEFDIKRVDGWCMDIVIKDPLAEKAFQKTFEKCFKNGTLKRRTVQGPRNNFYEYYIVMLCRVPILYLNNL